VLLATGTSLAAVKAMVESLNAGEHAGVPCTVRVYWGGRTREDYPATPSPRSMSSVYGRSKRIVEQLCAVYANRDSVEPVIGRCFALVGEHLPPDSPYAIGNLTHDALWRDSVRVRGDRRAVRTYLHGRDVVHWLTTLLLRSEAGAAYNVGSDQGISMAKLAREVVAVISPGKPVVAKNTMADDGSRYVLDMGRVAALRLRVETSLAEAILATSDAARGRQTRP
jgi:nucleoside-diphosphate-sugar epimerase